MLLPLLVAQIVVTAPTAATADHTEQDRVTETGMLAYGEWRNCVLKVTHHKSRRIKDHGAVADAAIEDCEAKGAAYRTALTALGKLYQLKDPDDFAARNVDQARKALHDIAMKELQ